MIDLILVKVEIVKVMHDVKNLRDLGWGSAV